MMARRIDGIKRLTKEQIEERDAKMFRWLNRKRMERVYEAAQRHGWYRWPMKDFEEHAKVFDYGDRIEATVEGSGRYRVEGYEDGEVILRKISGDWSEE